MGRAVPLVLSFSPPPGSLGRNLTVPYSYWPLPGSQGLRTKCRSTHICPCCPTLPHLSRRCRVGGSQVRSKAEASRSKAMVTTHHSWAPRDAPRVFPEQTPSWS